MFISDPIKAVKVHGFRRESIPDAGETIETDVPELINGLLLPTFSKIDIYFRDKKSCPFKRGNWICDVSIGDLIFCIKLPAEMLESDVLEYFKPLTSRYVRQNKHAH